MARTPSKTRVAVTAEVAAPAVTKKAVAKREKATPPAVTDFSGALANYYAGQLDAIDKKLRIRAGAESTCDPVSTGLLCADWVMSGGVRTAFNQVSGFEQAGKTTLTVGVLGGAVQKKVPLIYYNDGEGSLTPEYADAVLNSFGLSDVFDQRLRRYYSTNVLEEVTTQLARFARRVPDKLWSDEVGAWCYFLPKGLPQWTPVQEALKAAGLKPDKAADVENYWVYPTEYSGPEGTVFIDSWPSLIPEAVDDLIDSDKKSGAGLAIVARTLSEELPKFAGRLKRKGIILWSVNQLREAPMQLPPVKEAGGNALKLYTMVRNQMMVRAVPEGWDRDPEASGLCIEESAYGGGYDRYAFKSFSNTKNKLGRPFLKTMLRVWTSDEWGVARGYDPVFDTFNYLKHTAQATGSPKSGVTLHLKNSVKGPATALNGVKLPWHQFKAIIVAEHFQDRELLKPVAAELGLQKAPKLRETLFGQVTTDATLWGEQVSEAEE